MLNHSGIILRGVSKVLEFVQNNEDIRKYAYTCDDGSEGKSKLDEWNNTGNDITGLVALLRR